jgi:hypothetical protein
MGGGLVPDEILALSIDARVDGAAGGSRLAGGASLLGGLPIGSGRILARAGIWRAAFSSTSERDAVPTFELAGFIPTREIPEDSRHRSGPAAEGVVFGVREDLDVVNYFTVFVGVALFMVPGE